VTSSTQVIAGTGLAGGGDLSTNRTLWFGGTFSTSGNTGINITSSTGTWTFNYTGVNAITAGTGINLSSSSGNVTLWNGLSIATSTASTTLSLYIASSGATQTINYPTMWNTLAQMSTTTGGIMVASTTNGWKVLSVGADGKVLMASSTASNGVSWETVSGGSGISSLNGLTAATQTFSTTTGYDGGFYISSTVSNHQFNFPGRINDINNLATTTGNLIVASGTTWTAVGVGSNGKVLRASSTAPGGLAWETMTASAAAGGSDTQIQFNNGGVAAGDTSFTWASSTRTLSIHSTSTNPGLIITASSTPQDDMVKISNAGYGVSTAGVSGLQVDYYGGTSSVSMEASAARFNITPGTSTVEGVTTTWNGIRIVALGTGTSTTALNGIKFDTLQNPGSGIETAIQFGQGWDRSLVWLNPTSTLVIPSATGTVWRITNGSSTLLELKQMGVDKYGSSTFGAVVSAGAFIDKNSYFGEEFTSFRGGDCKGNVVATTHVQSRGSGGTTPTTCTNNTGNLSLSFANGTTTYAATSSVMSSSTALNGVEEFRASSTINNSGSAVAEYIGTNTAQVPLKPFAAVNLPIVVTKILRDTISSSSRSFVGLASSSPYSGAATTLAATTTPKNGIFFSNCYASTTQSGLNACDTGWYATVANNGLLTTSSCSAAPIANKWAYMKIEVRGPTDVHFFVDNDVSNGVQEVECGSGLSTSTNATAMTMLFMHGQHKSGATSTSRLAMDYFRVWQDDSATPVEQVDFTQFAPETTPADLTSASSFAQIFNATGTIEAGTLVSLDTLAAEPNFIKPSEGSFDPNVVGVAVGDPGITLGDPNLPGVRVATGGRAFLMVSAENGPIETGDYLTSSNSAGVAMKADKGGPVVGRALSPFDGAGIGSVFTLIQPSSYNGPPLASLLKNGLMPDDSLSELLSNSPSDFEANIVNTAFSRQILGKLISKGFEMTGLVSSATSTATSSSPLSEILTDRIGAGIEIITPHITALGMSIDSISSLNAAINIKNDTIFFGRPYFNADTGGFAVIKQGATSVDVTFEREYLTQPVVNASISFEIEGEENAVFENGIHHIITKKSTKGFAITLNKPAPADVEFSWIAIAVRNPKTFFSLANQTSTVPSAPSESQPAGQSSYEPETASSSTDTGEAVTTSTEETALPEVQNSTSTVEGTPPAENNGETTAPESPPPETATDSAAPGGTEAEVSQPAEPSAPTETATPTEPSPPPETP
jgi:hypothetical protein